MKVPLVEETESTSPPKSKKKPPAVKKVHLNELAREKLGQSLAASIDTVTVTAMSLSGTVSFTEDGRFRFRATGQFDVLLRPRTAYIAIASLLLLSAKTTDLLIS